MDSERIINTFKLISSDIYREYDCSCHKFHENKLMATTTKRYKRLLNSIRG